MKGTPLTIKCPSCKRGMYGHLPKRLGVRRTGNVGPRLVKSKHRAAASGRGFHGYPGEVECLDCGHIWYSTHPLSGRRRVVD